MTPAELSAAVRAAVRAAVEAGDLAVAGARRGPGRAPQVKEHGDYATNVALQLAKPAGRPPREVAELLAARLREAAGVAAVEVAGPGFLNIPLDAAARASWPGRSSTPAAALRPHRRRSAGQQHQPRVRLGQPDRADPPRRRPLGRGRRRAGPAAAGAPAPRSPASTTSTTPARRSTGSPARCWPRAQGRADARGRLRRRLHRARSPPRSSRPTRACSTCPTTRRRRCSGARASR